MIFGEIMKKTLLGISCCLALGFSSASADGWSYKDYQEIMGAGHAILGTKPAQQRKMAQQVDREVVRLMVDLGLSGGKFVAFAGEDANNPIVKRKKAIYQQKRRAKHTQTNAHLQFANASYKLSPHALNKVGALARTYQIAKGQIKQITIKGHTNSLGSDKANLLLSHNRAASVRAALQQRGIPANVIRIHGFGETQPMAGTNPAEPVNRRVEYAILKR